MNDIYICNVYSLIVTNSQVTISLNFQGTLRYQCTQVEYLKFYSNDLEQVQVMETINVQCKSISKIDQGVCLL